MISEFLYKKKSQIENPGHMLEITGSDPYPADLSLNNGHKKPLIYKPWKLYMENYILL